MAKVIHTEDLKPGQLNAWEESLVYNGLDCCVTHEVNSVLQRQLDNTTRVTYELRKALQAPVIEMNLRGIKVDLAYRDKVVKDYEAMLVRLTDQLNQILRDGVGFYASWSSPKQLITLFYEVMKLPPVLKRNAHGMYVPTVNRAALEKLQSYFIAQPVINHILALRDVAKKMSVLRTKIDPDGRMRTSFNIAGTETGRFSSSLSDLETGTNLQNIAEELRQVFVADEGMKFVNVDLEQAESRLVGAICWNLFLASRYLDATESGDLHTVVSKMVQPQMQWIGNLKEDRAIAEEPFYRNYSLRYMSKRLGHGTNYVGTPFTMAAQTKMPIKTIKDFQASYFTAFPEIQQWHGAVATQLMQEGHMTTMLGMRRWFFGRRNDDATHREAVAFEPQSCCAQVLNEGMLEVWRANLGELLLQVHDSILIQIPEEAEDALVPKIVELMARPIQLRNGRVLVIPCEAKTGWNWAPESKTNPNGLRKFVGADVRRRTFSEAA